MGSIPDLSIPQPVAVHTYAAAVKNILWNGDQPSSCAVCVEMCEAFGCCLSDDEFIKTEAAFFASDLANLWKLAPLTVKDSKHTHRKAIPFAIRVDVWDRSKGICYICLAPLHPFRDFTIDHVIAVANGGTDDIENLRAACKSCNSRKGAR